MHEYSNGRYGGGKEGKSCSDGAIQWCSLSGTHDHKELVCLKP